MVRGRPMAALVLSEPERQTLEGWIRRRTSAQALALRARIVLACAQGAANGEVEGSTKSALGPRRSSCSPSGARPPKTPE